MNKKALLPLIGLFLLVTGIVLPGSAHAQISEGGTPTSFKYQNTLKSDLPTVQIPINFSVEDLKTVDRWQVSQGAPLKVGVLLPTDLTIDNAGSWNTLPDGKRVWRLQVQAKDAIALMLSFRDFYIPENGKLFIYSSDKTHLIGAFTHHTNPPTKEYATEFLAGDKIILEYEAGISENEHPRIAIDAVGYGYNHLLYFPSFPIFDTACKISSILSSMNTMSLIPHTTQASTLLSCLQLLQQMRHAQVCQ